MTVLMCMATRRGQIGFRYSRLEALELCNSAASSKNGLPSTIIWVAVPCFCNRGIAEDVDFVWEHAAMKTSEPMAAQKKRIRNFMLSTSVVIERRAESRVRSER